MQGPNPTVPFLGNSNTSITKQGKYRLKHEGAGYRIEVMIETSDDEICYPASMQHPELIKMVSEAKRVHGTSGAGPFYINEWRQVIVPVGADGSAAYFYAGEYPRDVLLKMPDGEEFSGRPLDRDGHLLKPGDSWMGRPRPGIEYVLKAGGTDIEYRVEIAPRREKRYRLSKQVGPEAARKTAGKIAKIKGNAGGPFYVNEYRTLFGPTREDDGYSYVYMGLLTDEDAWFSKWEPDATVDASPAVPMDPPGPPPATVAEPIEASAPEDQRVVEPEPAVVAISGPVPRKIDIADGEAGHSFEALFSDYLEGAQEVIIEDPFMRLPHQVANLLRFCELAVRQGSVERIQLITRETTDDSEGKLENILRSLRGHGVDFRRKIDPGLHDRRIRTDHGWEINLGRGLDIYQRPDDWMSIGASDFNLRPCYSTTLVFHKLGNGE